MSLANDINSEEIDTGSYSSENTVFKQSYSQLIHRNITDLLPAD